VNNITDVVGITNNIFNSMQELNYPKTIELLNTIIEFELLGVIRYTYFSLILKSSQQTTMASFFKEQADESLHHAQIVGEILINLDVQFNLNFPAVVETYRYSVHEILAASFDHETKALNLYRQLLETVKDANVYIEEFVRNMITEEEAHSLELKRMLENFSE